MTHDPADPKGMAADWIKTIGVLGAGQMGSGIAQVAAASGFSVVLADSARAIAEKAKSKLATLTSRQVDKGKLSAADRDALLERIRAADGPDDFGAISTEIAGAIAARRLQPAAVSLV